MIMAYELCSHETERSGDFRAKGEVYSTQHIALQCSRAYDRCLIVVFIH